MPQFTIDVPETLLPLLTSKAEACGETPEEFIVSWLSVTLECLNDDVAVLSSESFERPEEERDE